MGTWRKMFTWHNRKVLSWKKRTYGMPPVEIHLWVKSMSLDISIEVDENNKKV